MFLSRIYKRCAALLVSVLFASAAFAVPDDNNSSVSVVESDWEGEVTLIIPISKVIPGDADGNETVDENDIMIIIDYIMGLNPEGFEFSLADVNGDNVVNIADVVMIANIILDKP